MRSRHQKDKWLVYGLGGGWGHINRCLSLGRIAARDRDIQILTNSPYLSYLSENNCQIITIQSECSHHLDRTRHEIQQIILKQDYNLLVVDTFPRGLGGELAEILPLLKNIPKVLIHRYLNPNYVRAKNLPQFVNNIFDRIIIPGESFSLPLTNFHQVFHTNYWLIRNADELPSLEKAYQLLKLDLVSNKEKLLLILASGHLQELSLYGQLARSILESFPDLKIRCLSPIKPPECPSELWSFHHPAFECLQTADIVIGSGGYNTVYECQSLGIPLVAFAFPRLYDRQLFRLQQEQQKQKNPIFIVRSIEEAIASIKQLLCFPLSKAPPTFHNGAVNAVNLIGELNSSRL